MPLASFVLVTAALLPLPIEESSTQRRVYARVAISAEGNVEEVVFRNRMIPDLERKLRERVAKWTFDPAKKSGTAVPSATSLQLTTRLSVNEEGGASLEIVEVLSGPEPIELVVPEYPRSLASKGMQGYVVVRCRINREGRCVDLTVESSTAPGDLSDSAMKALSAWRFEPEFVAGEPIETWVLVPFCFLPSRKSSGGCNPSTGQQLTAIDSPIRLRRDDVGGIR